MNWIYAYWQEIQTGGVIVGQWIRLLYEKLVKGIDDGTYIYDAKKANRAINFIEKFIRHVKGPLGGKHITLQLWQKALLSCIFGLVDPSTGYRMFHEVPIIIGRKMGKSLLMSGIMAYEAYLDGEYGGEIYCVATKLEQADLVYSFFKYQVDHEPAFSSITKPRKSDLYIEQNNTIIKKLPFQEKKADGLNPSLAILDEYSSWVGVRGVRQYEVIASGTGARNEPLIIGISSGGYENGGIYDELYDRGTAWLLGNSRETRLLPIFYTIDDINKWDDINELYKSLPGLGVSVSVQTMLEKINKAYQTFAARAEFITKYCCLKQNNTSAFLAAEEIENVYSDDHIQLEDFEGCYVCCGIDLGESRDLSAATVLIEKNGELYVYTHFWIPGGKLDEFIQRDGLPYDIYLQRGFVSLSGENIVEFEDIEHWCQELVEKYKLYPLVIGYDKWHAQYLIPRLREWFQLDDVVQGENLYPLMVELQAMMQSRPAKIHIGDNDLLKAHLFDVGIKKEKDKERGKPVKLSKDKHIDGFVSLIDALTVRSKYYADYGQKWKNEDD